MVKDHSNSKRGNPLPPRHEHQGILYMHNSIDRIAYMTAIVNPVVVHWLEREIAIFVHHKGSTTGVTKAVVCVILSVGWCI